MRDVLRTALRSALRSGLDRAVRWRRGRHRAGAVRTPPAVPVATRAGAVRTPPAVPVPVPIVPARAGSVPVPAVPVPVPVVPTPGPAVPTPGPAAPRVELGFRDGSTAELEAGSEQAVALQVLARTLTARS